MTWWRLFRFHRRSGASLRRAITRATVRVLEDVRTGALR